MLTSWPALCYTGNNLIIREINMKKALLILMFCYAAMITIAAKADGIPTDLCELTLAGNITIDAETIEVASTTGQLLIISQADGLSIDGRQIDLRPEQRALLEDYDQQLRDTLVPLTAIALEAVNIALVTISEMFYAFTDGEANQSLTDSLAQIDKRLSQLLSQTPDVTYIAADRIAELEDLMKELEPVIESSIELAAQKIIKDLGNAMVSGDTSLIVEVSSLMQRVDHFGTEMQANVSEKTRLLEARAASMCPQMRTLARTEQRLHNALPVLAEFDLVRDIAAPEIQVSRY